MWSWTPGREFLFIHNSLNPGTKPQRKKDVWKETYIVCVCVCFWLLTPGLSELWDLITDDRFQNDHRDHRRSVISVLKNQSHVLCHMNTTLLSSIHSNLASEENSISACNANANPEESLIQCSPDRDPSSNITNDTTFYTFILPSITHEISMRFNQEQIKVSCASHMHCFPFIDETTAGRHSFLFIMLNSAPLILQVALSVASAHKHALEHMLARASAFAVETQTLELVRF